MKAWGTVCLPSYKERLPVELTDVKEGNDPSEMRNLSGFYLVII